MITMRNTKKMTKKLAVVGVLLCLVAVATIGLVMTEYLNGTWDADSQVLFTWDDTNAEDLAVNIDLGNDFTGGDTEYTEHYMNYSSVADNALTAKFSIVDSGTDDAEGIEATLYYHNGTTWVQICNDTDGSSGGTHTFQPSDNIQMKIEFVASTYLKEGDYAFTFSCVDNSA